MQTFLASLEAIGSLLGLGAVGFYIIAKNIVSKEILRMLSALAIEVALPLYIFSNLIEKFEPSKSPGWWRMPIWWVLFTALMFLLVMLFSRLFSKDVRRETSVALFINNPTFVPIAIIIGAYGANSPYLVNLFLFTMFTVSFYFNFYNIFFKRSKLLCGVSEPEPDNVPLQDVSKTVKTRLKINKLFNPVIKITFLALFIKLLGIGQFVPDVILTITKQIGAMTFPLVMIILGGNIYLDMKKAGKIYFINIIKFVIIKNIAFPVIMLAILYFLRPSYDISLILLLEAASPPLSTVPVLISRQNGNMEIANQYLVSSFLFSVICIPLMLGLLNMLYN